jgi:SAM-dependent methyltransferase
MEPDWSTLRRLRDGFLHDARAQGDYWKSLHDLGQYDATFAQRIGWKWDFVLDDIARLGWHPPEGAVLDWGCGSGVASRAYLDQFGATGIEGLWLWDRSPLAIRFAVDRAREKYPELPVREGRPDAPALLIVSHVLNELPAAGLDELLAVAERAIAVLWVEPGTHDASHALIAIRERLRKSFHIIAPCPHSTNCGVLAPGTEAHWCHQFARPPDHVFRDAFWTSFSRTLEIDLRSLPLSFLVLDRRDWREPSDETVRVLGRPTIHKPSATMLGCHHTGLVEVELSRRTDPAGYRRLKKGDLPSLQAWQWNDGRLEQWSAHSPEPRD